MAGSEVAFCRFTSGKDCSANAQKMRKCRIAIRCRSRSKNRRNGCEAIENNCGVRRTLMN
jgi:hypothetical protein